PNNDEKWKDCDSTVFVRECVRLASESGYKVSNVDTTLLAERPKILPYVETMRERIADLLNLPMECVGIKATTMERLGFVGREEGIAAMAVALLERIKS